MDEATPGVGHIGATLAVFVGTALACGLIANAVSLGSYTGDLDDADFIVGPVDLPLVLVGLGVAVGVVLVARVVRSRWDAMREAPLLRLTFGLSAIAGLTGGACSALVAAPAVGANIGGGMAILFGMPVVIVLVAGSLVLAVRAVPVGSPPGGTPTSGAR